MSRSEKRCRRCGVCHHEHPDANKSGGIGRILSWQDGYCPACLAKRAEWRRRGARRYVDAVLAGDEYVSRNTPTQVTLEEVLS